MFRKLHGPFIYAEKHVLIRHILMVILFAVVCSAFWYSFEDAFRAIQVDKTKTYFDETKSTTKEEMERYNKLSECLNDTWEIKVLVHIRSGAIYIPTIQRNTLFIGISPIPGQSVIILPPLVRKMFSKKTIQAIESEVDHCAQTKMSLPHCALNALDKIHILLSEPGAETYK